MCLHVRVCVTMWLWLRAVQFRVNMMQQKLMDSKLSNYLLGPSHLAVKSLLSLPSALTASLPPSLCLTLFPNQHPVEQAHY